MKISKRDLKLLFFLFGVLLVAGMYYFVGNPSIKQIDELTIEVRTLEKEKSELELLKAKQPQYEEEIALMNADMRQQLSTFPANVKEENMVMYADMFNRISDIEFSEAGIAYNNLVLTITPTAAVEDYALGSGVSLYDRQTTYTFTVSYEDLKKLVDVVQNDEDKRNVEQFSVSFDRSTGKLKGSMMINMFSLAGADKSYQPPQIPDVPLGRDDVFGTVTTPDNGGEDAQ